MVTPEDDQYDSMSPEVINWSNIFLDPILMDIVDILADLDRNLDLYTSK